MTFYEFTAPQPGQSYNYPTLGFKADDGAILDGTLSNPAITNPPDGNWAVVGAGPESGITRYGNPTAGTDYSQPQDGTILQWVAASNAYLPRTPAQVVDGLSTSLNSAFTGAGQGLGSLGLSDSTTDIATIINAAVTAGAKHLVVPYRAAAWPALTTINLTDAWLEFAPGARISFNHSFSGLISLRSRLTGASFTSTYTGPSTTADATSATYGYPAREVLLHDESILDGGYYQEYACTGLHVMGAHVRYDGPITIKHIRHQQGWGNAIHHDGPTCWDVRGSAPIHIEDCDRAIETEDGAHDVNLTGGGYLKDIFPKGYAGQASAASYANYTFVTGGHSHEGGGGVQRINFGGTWTIENCGGGVGFIRSTGTNDTDMPRDCTMEEIHIIGRGMATGSEDVALNGHNNHVGRVYFEEGAGIAGGSFRIKGFASATGNTVGYVVSQTTAARPVISDDGSGLKVAGQPLPLKAGSRAWKFLSFPNRPVSVNNGLGNGTLRTTAVYLPYRITIDQVGTEITAAGDTGSVIRLGIYPDSASQPGSPIVDATVPADAVGIPMAFLGTAVTLEPGWYHFGGVLQGVTTTQPTVRCCLTADDGFLIFNTAATSVAPVGYSKGGVTGALPAWGDVSSTTNLAPRLWVRSTDQL